MMPQKKILIVEDNDINREMLREKLSEQYQFKYDRLTGLYSKEFFYQKAQEILEQNPEKPYHIICSDIENFKLFNDLLGVAAGDQLLCEIAREGKDYIGDRGICGRLGADRLMCLCEGKPEYTEEMFRNFTNRINSLSVKENNVVIKWGIYEITDRTVPVEQMCDRAFLAAERMKGQYRKNFAYYDDELRSKLLREQAITEAMESALEKEQFAIYLQPKYSLDGETLAGAEALVRWNHPELGFISPGEFIPLFEKNGFIPQLDQYVWEKVCALLEAWKKKGYPVFPVAVNVSRADVYQIDIVDVLGKMVQKYHLSPANLHLEITESAYTENANQIIRTVDQLREHGFVIEMDDFGSGYSSLNMLNQMKLDILKLDMKFIQSEISKPLEQGILRFIVGLARWMNLSVVAEGVESREQLERLREIGCDYAQGDFLSRPMPVQEFEKLLEAQPVNAEAKPHKKVHDSLHRRCMIVVDEDAEYRKEVRRIFGGQFDVVEADDMRSTFSGIADNGSTISMMILSMTLPEQESFRILELLGESKEAWRIPVLATAPQGKGLPAIEEMALRKGADDFTWKPHAPFSLKKRVSRLLGLTTYRERERQLQDEACKDYLTEIYNRRGFHTALAAVRKEDLPVAIYVFDLDDLKKVNDNYGHDAGDLIIQSFGKILRSHTREGDILSRYGGDEFVVILKHIDSKEIALKKGEEICNAFHEWQVLEETKVACSAGIVLCGGEEKISAELIDRADQALYRAKETNKGGCCLWEDADVVHERNQKDFEGQ